MKSKYPKAKARCCRLFLCMLFFVIGASSLNAQNTNINIGGGAGQLRITMDVGGNFNVQRESTPGSGIWQQQIYTRAPIFSMLIDDDFQYDSNGSFTIDGEVINVVGTRGEYSKTFSAMHNSEPFSVTVKLIYDTSNPDYFVFESTLDTRSLTSGQAISFAYGYDSYVNNCDGGVAWILPDPNSYNDNLADRNLTAAEVQGLRFAGGKNSNGVASLMGFFPIGRHFDRAYSATYGQAYSYNSVRNTQNNFFRFGVAATVSCASTGPWDNGVAVAYDNIPTGQQLTIGTGLTFTSSLDGTLDYTWNGLKDKTISVGGTAMLNLIYESYSPTPLSGIAFRANFPGLNISSSCSMSGWNNNGTSVCTNGNDYYKLSGAGTDPAGTGRVDVPITVVQYGQWVVSASSISETARTLPTGTPATLTASTAVNISNVSQAQVCRGNSSVVTVKLDGTNTTSQPITVDIDYTGSTATASDYVSRPTSVTIPVGANSATFTIVTSATAADNSTFNFRLSSTDKAFATIGTTNTGTVTVKPKPTLSSATTIPAVCSGSTVSYTATGSIAGTTFTWTRASVTGITPSTGSGSSATISEVLSNSTTSPITVTYTYSMSAPNACTNTQDVTVVVNPRASMTSAGTISAICSGGTVSYTATSNIAGTTFSWSRPSVAGISPSVGSGSNATINETLTNTTANPITVAYTYTLTTPSGCTSTGTVSVVVNPIPSLSSAASISAICSGGTASYTATSATTGTTYTWSRAGIAGINGAAAGSGSSATISEVLSNSTTAPITVTYAFTLTANGCTSAVQNVTVVVNPKPVLNSASTMPAICNGGTASYTATTATAGATYTWSRAAVTGITPSTGSGSSAAISETLTNSTTAPITVTYVYTITANGCASVPQNVTVVVNPTATLSSAATIPAVCSGGTASYTATSATTGTTYTWSRAAIAGINGGAAGSGSSATISETLTNSTTAPITVTYAYTLTANSCSSAVQNVTVVVNPKPVLSSASTIPAICSGATASYTATSATTGATYTWSRAAVAGINGGVAGSGSSASISETLTNSTASPITVTYAYTITANSCASVPQNVTVVVNPTPSLSSITSLAATCNGSTISYTATSATAGTTYTWSRAAIASINGGVAGSGSSAAISETLTNSSAAPVTVTYAYTLTANGCSNTQNVTVVVNPTLSLSSATTIPAICSGATVSYTATSPVAGATFSWSRAAVTGITPSTGSGSSATISETLTNTTTAPITVTYAFTIAGNGCNNVQNVTVVVNPKPILSSAATIPAICSGGTASYTATSATAGTTYTWSRAAVTGITPSTGSGSSAAISETLTNTTAAPITVTYAYTLTANGCSNTQNVTVVVNPKPILSSTTATGVCSNTAFSYTATSATTGTTFSWTRATVTGISNTAGSGSSAVISETLVNTTGSPVDVTYVVSMTANGCSNTQNVTVTVSPSPTLSSTLTPSAVCSGSPFSYTAASAVVGATFTWTRAAVTGISNTAGSGINGVISETLVNTTSAPVNVTYAVTITASGCANNTQNVVVTVNPKPTLSSATTITAVCGSSPISYTATSATVGTSFSWSRAAVTGITPSTGSGSNATISETLANTTASPITVTYVYTLTANGCSNTQNVTVVVNPRPVPTILGSASPCAGSRQTYNTAAGMSAYAWTISGGTIVSGQGTNSLTVDWGAAGSGNLSVTYTDTNGCTPASPTSQAITINVVPSPTVSGTFSVWQNSTWTYTTETGMNTYIWTVTGGTILSGQGTSSVSVQWTSGTGGTIKVSYRTPATCFADMSTSQTITIGSAELTLSFAPTTIDEGATSTGTVCLPTGTQAPAGGIAVALARKVTSTATAADYTMPVSVTIPAGQQCATFTITTLADDWIEGSERLDVTATATGLAVAEASVTINDRTPGDIVVERTLPADGNASEPSTNGSFRIRFKDANAKSVTNTRVDYTMSGTAINGTDYNTVSGTVVIPSGQNGVDVPITIKNNFRVEGTRSVVITITSATSL